MSKEDLQPGEQSLDECDCFSDECCSFWSVFQGIGTFFTAKPKETMTREQRDNPELRKLNPQGNKR